MNKLVRTLLLAIPLALAATGAAAQVDAAAAESLLRKSGIWKQLEGMRTHMQSGLAKADVASAADKERLVGAADAAFDVDRMRRACLDVLSRGLDAKHLPALVRWYDSPLGRTVTTLEEESSNHPRSTEDTVKEGNALLESLPSERRALLNDIVVVTKIPESATQMIINVAMATHRGVAAVSKLPAPSAGELKAALEAQRPQIEAALLVIGKASSALTYATVPTPELLQYAAFLKSDAGRHYSELGMRAFDAAFSQASEDFARRLATSLPGAKKL